MKAHWSPILLLLLPLLFLAHPLPSLAAVPQLLTPTNLPGDRPPEHRATVIRQRTVLVNVPALRGTNNGRLLLELFGSEIELDREDVESPRPDTLIWHGRVARQPGGFAILTLVHDVLIGHIVTQTGYKTEFYEIRYRGHGVHALVQLDQSRFAKDRLTADEPEVMKKKKKTGTPPPAEGANDAPTPTCVSDPGSDIDLLALYTPAARVGAGGTDAIEATILTSVYEANLSYINSEISQRLRLVHMEEVPHTEVDDETDKLALAELNDGVLDQVLSIRNTYSADVVALFEEYPDDYPFCGNSFVMKEVWNDYEILAYSIIVRNCALSYYTLAHELGHIMGARHDWFADPQNLSPYSYNHGFVAIAEQPQRHAYQTIMAYEDKCTAEGIAGAQCPRILYWSNPATTYPPGDPNAVALGVGAAGPERADNHLTLNNTAMTVANFRCSSRGTNNVWMKDTWNDTGDEPDPRTAGEDMWKSPYIWVRQSEDLGLLHQHQHEDPVIGVPNWIYVKLQNGGNTANGSLEIYGSNASPSLMWPNDWTRLGAVPVSSFAKNSVLVVPLQWTPSAAGHYCLLARWVSTADTMTFPETADIQGNVRNNNNLVWRNLFVVDFAQPKPSPAQTFEIRNTGGANARVRLLVRSSDPAGQSYLRQGAVTLSLDEPLLRGWREGGTVNQGLRIEGGLLRVTAADAVLDGLVLPPGLTGRVSVKFEKPSAMPTSNFVVDFVQLALPASGGQTPRVVGGVSYEIRTGPAGGPPVP